MPGRNHNYTVGWICAITTELVAAQAFLDEKHEGPDDVSPNDDNIYTLGRIGKHSVVIAVLPDGEYGIASATSVARDMLHSFPNIRLGLMVGIGGGAPSKKHDIRLGDIVVSDPGNGNSGVFQYDFGKTIQCQSFQTTGFLNKPPRVLLAAVSTLKAKYESDGNEIESTINRLLEKKRRLRNKYRRPDPSTDRLYQSGVVHPLDDGASCMATCGDDTSTLVSRPERTEEEDNPAIHYGLIASANQLMKDALVRDKLATEKNVLCFEMEAAGLMNSFPCLVIRGICDYSDSHKNKEWQGYAAMAAAAYAKDLLCKVPRSKVEAEKKIGEVLSGLQEVVEDHRDIARKQLKMQEDEVKQRLSDKQKECVQSFRLTESTKNVTYEWYKDRVEDRVEGTCMWFLKHGYFQEWLKRKSGPLLVSADPGCGKSVLAKYLIDHALPQSATICYFFFKDQDQNTVRQALCALLHQLFSQKPSLIQHAMKQFEEDKLGLTNSTRSLWAVLGDAVHDPQAGSVIIVLDALDECAESEFGDLMRNIESQLCSNQSGHGKLKYLLTSRPYEQIVSKFRCLLDNFPRIHIPGEEESETISREVNRVIQYRVDWLAKEKELSSNVKDHLADQLLKLTHRTYLWVYLVFEYLKEGFKKTPKGVEFAIQTLPRNVNQAYERILNKSKEDLMVRKVLAIILAAGRPLTLSEMNVAVNIDDSSQTVHDMDLEEEEEDFKSRLRSWCGLFVSIHHGKIYFLHQTAREFLLANLPSSTTISTELRGHHSITIHQAHNVLAELCISPRRPVTKSISTRYWNIRPHFGLFTSARPVSATMVLL
ncbi:purine and uridine phosphorylase [Lindgomyces ingoldianus]|uniref:Purine and uridine phosphorylase n=1 Tax=Lindgomyces ingoldianus TaxID=673940 RepID=A0ACB6QRC0_9PLEO|nr:purine and uridine phosphorylase [Lindgomyces ingoldianus]KAF2469529.1 purine and uridine phosphorylase [Lindgomyces ingoldianus]